MVFFLISFVSSSGLNLNIFFFFLNILWYFFFILRSSGKYLWRRVAFIDYKIIYTYLVIYPSSKILDTPKSKIYFTLFDVMAIFERIFMSNYLSFKHLFIFSMFWSWYSDKFDYPSCLWIGDKDFLWSNDFY